MSKEYVSNKITVEVVQTLEEGNNYLIGSEMGSGKNYWVREVLLPFASDIGKYTLILSHRTTIREQQGNYLEEYREDQARQFKGGMFENITYQEFENRILSGDDMLDLYDFIVCDECHYFTKDCNMNANVETSFDWLNNNDRAIKIFLSGTYKSFEYLPFRNMTQLKEANYNNSNCDTIGLFDNDKNMENHIKEVERRGMKLILLTTNISYGESLIGDSRNATLLTSSNKENNKEYNNIVKHRTFDSNMLVSTPLLCEGSEIFETDVNSMIIYDIFDLEMITQSSGRVRDRKINMLCKKPSYQKIRGLYNKYKNLMELIEEFECNGAIEFVKKYGNTTIMNSHKFINIINVIDPISGQEYQQLKLHQCNVANIKYNYHMYMDFLLNGFENCLQEYFPNALIYDYDLMISKNLIKEKILNDFIGKRLFKEEQEKLKGLLIKEYGFKKASITSINKEFKDKEIPYTLKSKKDEKRDSNTYKQRYWLLEVA